MYIFGVRVPSWGSVPPLVFRSVSWGVVLGALFGVLFWLSCFRVRCLRFGWWCVAVWGLPVASSSSFVPSASSALLPGGVSAVVPVPSSLGSVGGVVVGSAWVSRSRGVVLPWSGPAASAPALAVWFAGSSVPLVCLRSALPASGALARLASAASAAGASGSVVFPVVAVGASGVAASGFFCGLSASAPVAPSAAVVVPGSFAS